MISSDPSEPAEADHIYSQMASTTGAISRKSSSRWSSHACRPQIGSELPHDGADRHTFTLTVAFSLTSDPATVPFFEKCQGSATAPS
jgi:hypothetical protein